MALDYPVRYCPKCGEIEILRPELVPVCQHCQSKLRDTEYIFADVVEHGDVKPEIQKVIFDKYIKNNPMYSDEAATKRNNTSNSSHIPSSYKPKESSQVTCPYCKSTNTKKITNTSKAVHTVLFGVFSISRNSKEWHCNSCGSDF